MRLKPIKPTNLAQINLNKINLSNMVQINTKFKLKTLNCICKNNTDMSVLCWSDKDSGCGEGTSLSGT